MKNINARLELLDIVEDKLEVEKYTGADSIKNYIEFAGSNDRMYGTFLIGGEQIDELSSNLETGEKFKLVFKSSCYTGDSLEINYWKTKSKLFGNGEKLTIEINNASYGIVKKRRVYFEFENAGVETIKHYLLSK